MSEIEKIKLAIERGIKALTLKPSLGLGTGKSKTRIKNGLTCEIQEGNWKFLADMPESVGGNALGSDAGSLWSRRTGKLSCHRLYDEGSDNEHSDYSAGGGSAGGL
jgi:hypothetical protein